jgi:hypothetical protein
VSWFPHEQLQHFASTHGYWVVGLVVGLESMGLPLPGETVLVLATIFAATDPNLNVWSVITAAAVPRRGVEIALNKKGAHRGVVWVISVSHV